MNIVFVGAVDFSRHCLEQVIKNGGNVSAVFTPVPELAYLNSDFVDLGEVAARHGIPIHRVRRLNDPENVALIRELQPDVILVFGFSQLVSKEILSLPRLGCIGSHPALLPKDRGRHPIIWALVDGETESGLTFFFLEEGADTGDIIWQRPFAIALEDDAASLAAKCYELASEAIAAMLPQLEQGDPPRTPQDHSKATYRRKRGEKDGEIDWSRPTAASYNLIRALARPYVGAHTLLRGQKVRVWRSRMVVKGDAPPGSHEVPVGVVVAEGDDGLVVRTGDGLLVLTDWDSPDGARPGAGSQFAWSSE